MRVNGPSRGVSDVLPQIDQPGDTAPPEAWSNGRINSDADGRATYGRRMALAPIFAQTLGDGTRVQAVGVIDAARGSDYTPGQIVSVGGITSLAAPQTTGQAWLLDNQLSPIAVMRDPYPDLDGDATPPSADSNGWRGGIHPSNPNKFCFATLQEKDYGGSIGTRTITHLNFVDLSLAPASRIVWRKEVEDKTTSGTLAADPRDLRTARVFLTENFVILGVGPYLHVYRQSDGVYIQRLAIPTWAYHIIDVRYTPRSPKRVYVVAWGNPTVDGPVLDDTFAEGADFRACVIYYKLDDKATSAVNDAILTLVNSTNRKAPSYTYYENHATLRFSEWLPHSPRGFLPFSLSFGQNQTLYVDNGRQIVSPVLLLAGANQAFGPSSSFPINGSTPYFCLFEMSTGGNEYNLGSDVDQWPPTLAPIPDPQVFRTFGDSDSLRDDWESTGWFNDRPVDASLEPIAYATADDAGPSSSICACDTVWRDSIRTTFTNNVFSFAAGKTVGVAGPPDTRANVFGYDINGALVWKKWVGGDVLPHCCVYDAYRNLLVVAGVRNNSWPGSSSRYACLWRLDPENGNIVDFFDTGDDTWAYGLDVRFGRTLLITDHVPA